MTFTLLLIYYLYGILMSVKLNKFSEKLNLWNRFTNVLFQFLSPFYEIIIIRKDDIHSIALVNTYLFCSWNCEWPLESILSQINKASPETCPRIEPAIPGLGVRCSPFWAYRADYGMNLLLQRNLEHYYWASCRVAPSNYFRNGLQKYALKWHYATLRINNIYVQNWKLKYLYIFVQTCKVSF